MAAASTIAAAAGALCACAEICRQVTVQHAASSNRLGVSLDHACMYVGTAFAGGGRAMEPPRVEFKRAFVVW